METFRHATILLLFISTVSSLVKNRKKSTTSYKDFWNGIFICCDAILYWKHDKTHHHYGKKKQGLVITFIYQVAPVQMWSSFFSNHHFFIDRDVSLENVKWNFVFLFLKNGYFYSTSPYVYIWDVYDQDLKNCAKIFQCKEISGSI